MPSTVAMMIGFTSTPRAACPTTRERPRSPPCRASSSSTVTELNTMTSSVMISSAGTHAARVAVQPQQQRQRQHDAVGKRGAEGLDGHLGGAHTEDQPPDGGAGDEHCGLRE